MVIESHTSQGAFEDADWGTLWYWQLALLLTDAIVRAISREWFVTHRS